MTEDAALADTNQPQAVALARIAHEASAQLSTSEVLAFIDADRRQREHQLLSVIYGARED